MQWNQPVRCAVAWAVLYLLSRVLQGLQARVHRRLHAGVDWRPCRLLPGVHCAPLLPGIHWGLHCQQFCCNGSATSCLDVPPRKSLILARGYTYWAESESNGVRYLLPGVHGRLLARIRWALLPGVERRRLLGLLLLLLPGILGALQRPRGLQHWRRGQRARTCERRACGPGIRPRTWHRRRQRLRPAHNVPQSLLNLMSIRSLMYKRILPPSNLHASSSSGWFRCLSAPWLRLRLEAAVGRGLHLRLLGLLVAGLCKGHASLGPRLGSVLQLPRRWQLDGSRQLSGLLTHHGPRGALRRPIGYRGRLHHAQQDLGLEQRLCELRVLYQDLACLQTLPRLHSGFHAENPADCMESALEIQVGSYNFSVARAQQAHRDETDLGRVLLDERLHLVHDLKDLGPRHLGEGVADLLLASAATASQSSSHCLSCSLRYIFADDLQHQQGVTRAARKAARAASTYEQLAILLVLAVLCAQSLGARWSALQTRLVESLAVSKVAIELEHCQYLVESS